MRNILILILLVSSIISMNCNYIQYKYTYTSNFPATGAPHRIIPIYVDKTFSEQDKLAIDNAINQWNYVFNNQMILRVVDYQFDMQPELIIKAQKENAFLFLKVDSNFPGIPDKKSEEECKKTNDCSFTLAWCDRIGGSVMKVVRSRIQAEDLEHVVLHEIGHLLYLKHTADNRDSLMVPKYNRYAYLCVDQDSVNKVAKNYGLDAKRMNYCLSKR